MDLYYRELVVLMQTQVTSQGATDAAALSDQALKNRLSTLHSFLAFHGKTVESAVGKELLSRFDESLKAYSESLTVSSHSKSDRRSHLRAWRKAADSVLHENRRIKPVEKRNSEVSPFHLALRAALATTGDAPKTIAKRAGASTTALARWLKGAFPNRRAFPSVRRLERELKLEAGALESLIPAVKKALVDAASVAGTGQIDYRIRLARNIKDIYYIQEDALSADFLVEWKAFFAYKTDKRTTLARHSGGTWRLQSGEKQARLPSVQAWRNGLCCTTAQKNLDKFRSFFGFLARPREEGGYGVSTDAAQSLAWFASRDAVNAYLEFMRGRSGGLVHGGHAAFAALTASLVNTTTGFVTQQPNLIARLPPGTLNTDWSNACHETWQLAKEWLTDATDVSRRPEDPIQSLLDMSEPLAPLFRAVELLDREAACAAPGSPLEATLKRDALALSIVLANPLRLRNLVTMTWRPNNSGSLYRREDGQWRIRFSPQDFKNDRKAIKGVYDAPLPRSLGHRIEEYLDEFRPRLLRADTKADWLFPNDKSGKWTSLNKQFFRLTRRLIPQTLGFGPHAIRHLVATDYLRKNPNDFLTVSQLLHDKLETVLSDYAHLRQDDAFAKYEVHLRGVMAS
ncbi:hypothetical protein RI103_02245 [Paraburkholderia sp. FT54]|uniref:tyrosine-type recombinase/integrase n=1 Tax=Paraburkholderia sp. FT54 TaxID=3074437 RepID=UPI0028779C43|nr:tyrosine-type recombinase/integrase [Paraburkholderia sp. FT54]WNC90204.1 hypothetical protein RI103_02245 [Paraburkholderia sp. FT54]